LDCLVNPEQRFKYWVELILEVLKETTKDVQQRAQKYTKFMIESIINEDKKFIGKSIGKVNKFFATSYKWSILDAVGSEGEKVVNYWKFVEQIKDVFTEISKWDLP